MIVSRAGIVKHFPRDVTIGVWRTLNDAIRTHKFEENVHCIVVLPGQKPHCIRAFVL